MLKQLELNYFKKHEKLTVNFTAGLNGITGPNYKGKSTILLGIMYCLGGARMVPGTRIATRGTNSGFKQTLWFEIPGKGDYMVQRTKTSAKLEHLSEDGCHTLAASGTSAVNNAIAELLGMPLRRFAQIKYAKQKLADAILKAGSGELFKIVTELTGLERIMHVLALLDNDLKVHKHVLDMTPMFHVEPVQEQLAQLQVQYEGAANKLAESADELNRFGAEIELGIQEERRFSNARSHLLELQREVRHAEQTYSACQKRVESVSDQFGEAHADGIALCGGVDISLEWPIEEWENKRKLLAEQEQNARDLYTEVGVLTRQAASLDESEEELVATLQRTLRELESMEYLDPAVVQEWEDDLARCVASRPEVNHKLKHAEAALNGGACASCERPFENFDEKAARQAVADARHASDLLENRIRNGTAQVAEFRRRQQAYAKLEMQESQQQRALEDFRSHAAKLRRRLAETSLRQAEVRQPDQIAQELAGVNKQLTALHKVKDTLTRLSNEQHVADKDLIISEQKLAVAQSAYAAALQQHGLTGPEEAGDKLEKVQAHLDEVRSVHASIANACDHYRDDANRLKTQVKLLEQEVATGQANNDKHEETRLKVVAMTQLRDLIRTNRDRYSKQVWNVFMASASLFASNITGGNIESVSRDIDGAFTFFEEGYEMAMEEASGAQQAIIGCAVQMALAEAAQCPLDVVLMDEPTADMDPEHALAFSTLLAASGKQVVMVSHRELDGSVFNHSIAL